MGFNIQVATGLVALVAVSLLSLRSASASSVHTPAVVVGGSEKWHFGFNYTLWAIKHGRFYINDALVFKYDPPSNTTPPHDVYLLPNLKSFVNCDMRKAKLLADVTKGGGNGFSYVLKKWKPYYFACGQGNGVHCNVGMMKFIALPCPRRVGH